ncbi:MAG TPA: zinc dependent phospholipase C family protein [Bryobacteraceae bacterium]|nr:zinc dependent phospholipase C family protein [Bryobacteraceae bacterium]
MKHSIPVPHAAFSNEPVRYDIKLRRVRLFLAACLLFSLPEAAFSYSVLTHELLIDLTWKQQLEPLLLKRFPGTTAAELQRAQSYAYGGCVIQDLGYYPFAHEFFSNLTHYVRSGDFVTNLLRDARTVDEYAFALGALSHYIGDNIGHHDAINLATAISFPGLERKYGPVVTYDQNAHAHIRTELAFDIDQLSHHRLAPGAYLRFIGFRVPTRVLAQAFRETYSLSLRSVIGQRRPAIRSYRTSVRSFLPRIAHAESVLHGGDFPPDVDDAQFQLFLEHIAQADFQKDWNRYRRKPGVMTHLMAVLIYILPKIGPLSELAIKIPTPATQDLYVKSVNRTIALYSSRIEQLATGDATGSLPNRDLDTGEETRPGAYARTDQTYAQLLHTLVANPSRPLARGVKEHLLDYYSAPNAPIRTKRDRKAWARVQSGLVILRNMPVTASPRDARL